MKMTQFFAAQLEAEGSRTRRALERVPNGVDDWKPHEKSMAFDRLANLVANMPSWITMIINRDDLDLNPPRGSKYNATALRTSAELVGALEKNAAEALAALNATNDDHLLKPWRLLVGGNVVAADPRHAVIRDTFAHLAHHRGQLTVYLRMKDLAVPAIYGPSADESRFD